jgi:RNA polymerase sigma-70 factor (ECF subfamily)
VDAEILEGAGGRHEDPLDALITRERAKHLWAALEKLKTLDRETLVAFYIQGESLIEIAERLDTPVGTIKRRLHTARKRLKAELEAGVADSDEWSMDAGAVEDEPELIGAF